MTKGARRLWTLLFAAGVAVPAAAQHADHAGQQARFGNPSDLDGYIAGLQDPERDAWQHPDEVMAALGLKPGQTACDLGAGPGYFTLRLARAVGPAGRVFAVDVEPRILDALRTTLGAAGVRNVTPVLGLGNDPLLPPGSCDLILIVDTYHHFPDPPAYLGRLAASLAPGGRIANIDFRADASRGPRHKIPRADFLEQALGAGYAVEREEDFLPEQYFLLLRPVR